MPMDRERARRGRSRGDRAVTEQTVIRIMCPNLGCQRVLAVPDHARGKLVRCRSCGTNIRIPRRETASLARPRTARDARAAGRSRRRGLIPRPGRASAKAGRGPRSRTYTRLVDRPDDTRCPRRLVAGRSPARRGHARRDLRPRSVLRPQVPLLRLLLAGGSSRSHARLRRSIRGRGEGDREPDRPLRLRTAFVGEDADHAGAAPARAGPPCGGFPRIRSPPRGVPRSRPTRDGRCRDRRGGSCGPAWIG